MHAVTPDVCFEPFGQVLVRCGCQQRVGAGTTEAGDPATMSELLISQGKLIVADTPSQGAVTGGHL